MLELLGLVIYPWPTYQCLFHAKEVQTRNLDYYKKHPPWVAGSITWIAGPYFPWVTRLTGFCFLFLWLLICGDLLRYLSLRH